MLATEFDTCALPAFTTTHLHRNGGAANIGVSQCNVTSAAAAAYAFVTDAAYTTTPDTMCAAVSASGRTAYRYLFNQTMSTSGLGLLGAIHSINMPFVFDSYAAFGAYMRDPSWTPTAAEILFGQQVQECVVLAALALAVVVIVGTGG